MSHSRLGEKSLLLLNHPSSSSNAIPDRWDSRSIASRMVTHWPQTSSMGVDDHLPSSCSPARLPLWAPQTSFYCVVHWTTELYTNKINDFGTCVIDRRPHVASKVTYEVNVIKASSFITNETNISICYARNITSTKHFITHLCIKYIRKDSSHRLVWSTFVHL